MILFCSRWIVQTIDCILESALLESASNNISSPMATEVSYAAKISPFQILNCLFFVISPFTTPPGETYSAAPVSIS